MTASTASSSSPSPSPSPETIRAAFWEARQNGKPRHRDIAQQLQISEGQLIAAHASPDDNSDAIALQALRLRPDWAELVAALADVGTVMALTRNEACVHEKIGLYAPSSQHAGIGIVRGADVDLRIFYSQWAHGFAVDDHSGGELQRSLQFFDASGLAMHKVFLKPGSHVAAFDALLARFAAPDQSAGMVVQAAAAAPSHRADSEVDVAALQRAWSQLKDSHDFPALLQAQQISREQACRLVGQPWARALPQGFARKLFEGAAAQQIPLMIFTSNTGTVQIHTGPVHKIMCMGPWLNVLDPNFNLHLREDLIASTWLVCKPSKTGLVHSIELLDAQGQAITQIFAAQPNDSKAAAAWLAWIEQLATPKTEEQTCTN